MNIDWPLFHMQKELLVRMTDDPDRPIEETELFDGVIHLMDAIQDEFEPLQIDEETEDENDQGQ